MDQTAFVYHFPSSNSFHRPDYHFRTRTTSFFFDNALPLCSSFPRIPSTRRSSRKQVLASDASWIMYCLSARPCCKAFSQTTILKRMISEESSNRRRTLASSRKSYSTNYFVSSFALASHKLPSHQRNFPNSHVHHYGSSRFQRLHSSSHIAKLLPRYRVCRTSSCKSIRDSSVSSETQRVHRSGFP